MEVVPSLCASGTVGVAAIGFAFGHPQNSIGTRQATTRRKPSARGTLDDIQLESTLPSTPSPLSHPTSAPTTRLRKRSSLARPLSSANRLSGGDVPLMSTPSKKINDEATWTDLSSKRDSKRSSSAGSFPPELKNTGTARSSWLRRMSTLSSLRTGSPVSAPQPESPSLTYSNGSIAPILPSPESSTAPLPRNKLVKRSSSQRALQGSNLSNSTIRRPATSHQRTTTNRHHNPPSDEPSPARLAPKPHFDDLEEDRQAYDDSLQTWVPFFTANGVAPIKEGFLRKRGNNNGATRGEPLSGMVPNVNGLPTLLLATSISSGSSDSSPPSGGLRRSHLERPSTAVGFESFISSSPEMPVADAREKNNLKSRHSFSLVDMFSYSSPSSWKAPKSSNMKKGKGASTVTNTRRISSAPHPTNLKQVGGHENIKKTKLGPIEPGQRPSSSHIPPLNPLSSFDVDLPATAPSYPSPQEKKIAPSLGVHSSPSPSVSSPLSFATTRSKKHRPSGALSDHTSTLLGSDQDTGRFLSSDEDEIDFRSDTIYDSTRTRATENSVSGVRRLPIKAVFDDSPPDKAPKNEMLALEDFLSNESTMQHSAPKRRTTEDELSLSTAVHSTVSHKEEEYHTAVHAASKPIPNFSTSLSSSPPVQLPEIQMDPSPEKEIGDFENDHDWPGDDEDHQRKDPMDKDPTVVDADQSSLNALLKSSSIPRGPSNESNFHTLKPNSQVELEWSENRAVEKEPSQQSSPRSKTMHDVKNDGMNRSRLSGRRGSNALHLRSQSVPAPQDGLGHRSHNTSKLFGTKGASEEWDGDFEFDDPPPRPIKHNSNGNDAARDNGSTMIVPRAIMERQASVHGQFGQVKELTVLVEELKQLQQQAIAQGIMQGQSIELWKEAEGIINLATVDNEEEIFPPRSPPTGGFDLDLFDEGSPSHGRRKSGFPSPKEERPLTVEHTSSHLGSSRSSLDKSNLGTPPSSKPRRESILSTPPMSRPRKESTAQAKSVLETIHQQRSQYNSDFLDAKSSQKKLPFDTTSLRDLVTRAGVVTRALREIVRRAENSPSTPKPRSLTSPDPPPDPEFSQIFHQPASSPSINKSPRVTQSPKSASFRGGSITGNDNEINGHMKMMTVV